MATPVDRIVIPGTLFYLWMGYGAMLVFAALTIVALRLRVVRDGNVIKRPHAKCILAFLAALMLAIVACLFFQPFYAIEPRPGSVRLVYPWPRASINLPFREIQGGQIKPQRRRAVGGLAILKIIANDRIYESAGINTPEMIQQLKALLASWEAQHNQTK